MECKSPILKERTYTDYLLGVITMGAFTVHQQRVYLKEEYDYQKCIHEAQIDRIKQSIAGRRTAPR